MQVFNLAVDPFTHADLPFLRTRAQQRIKMIPPFLAEVLPADHEILFAEKSHRYIWAFLFRRNSDDALVFATYYTSYGREVSETIIDVVTQYNWDYCIARLGMCVDPNETMADTGSMWGDEHAYLRDNARYVMNSLIKRPPSAEQIAIHDAALLGAVADKIGCPERAAILRDIVASLPNPGKLANWAYADIANAPRY